MIISMEDVKNNLIFVNTHMDKKIREDHKIHVQFFIKVKEESKTINLEIKVSTSTASN